jgi:hypothetical protein
MTRTTDDLHPDRPSPLGPPIRKPAPPAPAPAPAPRGPSGIVTDADGRMRTTTHPHS